MTKYRHTQIGLTTLLLIALVIGAIAVLVLAVPEARILAGIVLGILLIVSILFGTLTVEVTTDELVASFGIGLIRRSIRMTEIQGAHAVRNKWWYGWGIRLTPHGWMFNVSGLDAIELAFDDGRKFRIGTDEPERLCAVIHEASARLD